MHRCYYFHPPRNNRDQTYLSARNESTNRNRQNTQNVVFGTLDIRQQTEILARVGTSEVSAAIASGHCLERVPRLGTGIGGGAATARAQEVPGSGGGAKSYPRRESYTERRPWMCRGSSLSPQLTK